MPKRGSRGLLSDLLDKAEAQKATREKEPRRAPSLRERQAQARVQAQVQQDLGELRQQQGQQQGRTTKRQLAPELSAVEDFVISKGHEAAVRKTAKELGIEVDIRPVDPKSLYHTFPAYEKTAFAFGYGEPTPRAAYQRALQSWAERKADRYLRVTARAPQPPERVVGLAVLDEGVTIFYTLPGEDDPWTARRMKQVDFRRCDLCHRRIARVKSYLVQREDGSIFVAGGKCADNLNLAKRISNLRRAFKAFMGYVERSEDDWGAEYGGFGSKGNVVDPGTALVVADLIIAQSGYVKSDEGGFGGVVSTKVELKELMLSKPGSKTYGILRKMLSSLPPGHREKLLERVNAWLDAEQKNAEKKGKDLSFVTNMKTAVASGNVRLLGFLAYVPEGLRRWESAQVQRRQRSERKPWQPEITLLYDEAGVELSAKERYHQYEYEPTVAEVGVTLVTTDPRRQAKPQSQRSFPGVSPFVVKSAGYMVKYALGRNVRLTGLSSWVDDSYPKQNQELFLERALIKAMSAALGSDPVIPVCTGDDLKRIFAAHPEAQGLLGITDKQALRATKVPAKRLTKGLSTKLAKYVPGLWTVHRINTIDANFGSYFAASTIHFITFLRESDGSLLFWKASNRYINDYHDDGDDESGYGGQPLWYTGTGYLDTGDKVWIKSATIGLPKPPHPTYGVEGRKIMRVKYVLVDSKSRLTPQ